MWFITSFMINHVVKSIALYNRNIEKNNSGYQIDLLFMRDDKVITICEIKYLQTKVGTTVIDEMAEKLSVFINPKKHTLQKVLISIFGPTDSLFERGYFDRFVTLADFFR